VSAPTPTRAAAGGSGRGCPLHQTSEGKRDGVWEGKVRCFGVFSTDYVAFSVYFDRLLCGEIIKFCVYPFDGVSL
jgi:hypothetical protein